MRTQAQRFCPSTDNQCDDLTNGKNYIFVEENSNQLQKEHICDFVGTKFTPLIVN